MDCVDGSYLTPQIFDHAVNELRRRDHRLASVIDRFGPPPFWQREPGFPALLLIILEQQVSLASARAAYDKLVDLVGEVTPGTLLAATDGQLRACGFSRQKSRYARILAEEIRSGRLDLDALATQPDEQVFATLTALTGIGPWSAKVYLLMALRRPDIWPTGDLALAVAWQETADLARRPSQPDLEVIAAGWQPWRAVAARILWCGYLGRRGMAW